MLMTGIGGEVWGTLVLAAGLAALMSTMDSQLLTLSSIFSRDLWPLASGGRQPGAVIPRLFVALLALAGLAIAVFSDATILTMGVTAFTGLAALFPTVLFGLYLKSPRPAAGLASICAGEALAIAFHFEWIESSGILPAVWVILASFLVFLAVQWPAGGVRLSVPVVHRSLLFSGAYLLIFIAALDFYRWGEVGAVLWGWPAWAWMFVGLSIVQTLLSIRFVRSSERASRS
jgi:SSS family solute:Na+ symporter